MEAWREAFLLEYILNIETLNHIEKTFLSFFQFVRNVYQFHKFLLTQIYNK